MALVSLPKTHIPEIPFWSIPMIKAHPATKRVDHSAKSAVGAIGGMQITAVTGSELFLCALCVRCARRSEFWLRPFADKAKLFFPAWSGKKRVLL
jgi:hypothetical protein